MTITKEQLNAYRLDMIENEIAPSTIQRYMSIAESLARWIGERPMSKELLVEWRAQLTQSVGSVNIAVAAVNRLLVLIGCEKCRLKHLKTQSTVFRPVDKELTREEYERRWRLPSSSASSVWPGRSKPSACWASGSAS